MLLEKLRDYADGRDLPPSMYDKMPIRWLIELDRDGRFLGFISMTGGGTKRNDRGKEYNAPFVARSSGTMASLLADKAEYVIGLAGNDAKPDRAAKRHLAFVEQVRACAEATGEAAVEAVVRFLEGMDLAALPIPEDMNAADNLTFRVDGELPIHLPAVQQYWADVNGGGQDGAAESADRLMQCLICGERRKPVKRLPFKIKPIPGGQTSGLALISANVPAFESYGLEASLVAPTCARCGERFSKAANALIAGRDTHITIGPLVYLFWTKEESGFSVASLLSTPQPDEVRALITSVFGGKRADTGLDPNPFYATAFSASGARVVVRDWLDTAVGEVRRDIARYFAFQRIVENDGSEGKPYGLYALAASTVRDASRELPPNVPKLLLHMALEGGSLPMGLLFQAVKRNRAEQRITRPRAALIKMVLLSQREGIPQEDLMVQLDPQNDNAAYLCGRLLAVLEAVQGAAIPGANTTITDRFFGTASSAPASVFGRLIRGSQPHLGKLRKERRGAYEALEKRLEEILAGLPGFPKTLTLEDQGLFGLGYYHQRAADRAARLAHMQVRDEGNDVSNGNAAE